MKKVAFLDFKEKYVYLFIKSLKDSNFNLFLIGNNEKEGKIYSSKLGIIFFPNLENLPNFDVIFFSNIETYKKLKKEKWFEKIKDKLFFINPFLFNNETLEKNLIKEVLEKTVIYDYIEDKIYFNETQQTLVNFFQETYFYINKEKIDFLKYKLLLTNVYKSYLSFLITQVCLGIKISKKEVVLELNSKEKELLRGVIQSIYKLLGEK